MKKFETVTVTVKKLKAIGSVHSVGIFLFHVAYVTMKFDRDFEI